MSADDLESAHGFLNDSQLLVALQTGQLFQQGTWREDLIQQCSYLLTLGTHAEYPGASKPGKAADGHRIFERHVIPGDGKLVIEPGQTVLAYIRERFLVSDQYMAFTIPRGLFYVESLQVGASYVDPGFGGEDFFVPITNFSDRIVEVPVGTPLVRAFVYKLSAPVNHRFDRGQSPSWKQELQVVESQPPPAPPTAAEAAALSRDELAARIQASVPFGNVVAEAISRLPHPSIVPSVVTDATALSDAELTAAIQANVPAGNLLAEAVSRLSAAGTVAALGPVAGAPGAHLQSDLQIRRTLLLNKGVLYVLSGLMAWQVVPDGFWSTVNGENLPGMWRFLVVAISGSAAYGLLAGDVRRTWAHLRDATKAWLGKADV